MTRLFILAVLAALPATASAEVKFSTPGGFALEATAMVPVSPAEAYAAIGEIGRWWNGSHTYSGNAANLRLDLKAGGCMCETIPDGRGTIEHLRIVYAQPGVALRGQGGLGPLQSEGVTGSLTWAFKPVPGGTEITQTYVVGGYFTAGAERLAPLVDQVMSEQFAGLTRYLSDKGGK